MDGHGGQHGEADGDDEVSEQLNHFRALKLEPSTVRSTRMPFS